eukprot:TRINITY_DN30024_c0_g1_i1.p1 TRINITY_DN30024_c0_g1~~TRINITY_DN30024_c0_g1_i1.p1  ORF type:complete len:193 (+),score=29.21 TRINITY_DN30024_c0_g1_i1:98-676(+)
MSCCCAGRDRPKELADDEDRSLSRRFEDCESVPRVDELVPKRQAFQKTASLPHAPPTRPAMEEAEASEAGRQSDFVLLQLELLLKLGSSGLDAVMDAVRWTVRQRHVRAAARRASDVCHERLGARPTSRHALLALILCLMFVQPLIWVLARPVLVLSLITLAGALVVVKRRLPTKARQRDSTSTMYHARVCR